MIVIDLYLIHVELISFNSIWAAVTRIETRFLKSETAISQGATAFNMKY